jgi:hypothetical protein
VRRRCVTLRKVMRRCVKGILASKCGGKVVTSREVELQTRLGSGMGVLSRGCSRTTFTHMICQRGGPRGFCVVCSRTWHTSVDLFKVPLVMCSSTSSDVDTSS